MSRPAAVTLGAADPAAERLALLRELERKVLWLSAWTIHNANHIRPKRDGLKVGGHQASSASLVTLMTALYFDVLRPEDRVAVKPHASPVFHAIQYLLGRQTRDKLERFRALGGAQSYPSRTKDDDDVDFSTGSVGLGVAMTSFASLVQDYVRAEGLAPDGRRAGRMVALVGDAELDEGNIYEAHARGLEARRPQRLVDHRLQPPEPRQRRHRPAVRRASTSCSTTMGWNVVTLKYGKLLRGGLRAARRRARCASWIDDCPNSLYSALTFKGGAAWRAAADGRPRRDAAASASSSTATTTPRCTR